MNHYYRSSSSLSSNIFDFTELNGFIESLRVEELPKVKNNKKTSYYNIPAAFDIETTSTVDGSGEKIAFMYVWQLQICRSIIIGRTWPEFTETMNAIVEHFNTGEQQRLVVYVHNLAYEFQFIQHRFEWSNVFAIDRRKPVYALTVDGIEFRCSYILSGYSLSQLGGQLLTHQVEKRDGDLDYNLIRHSSTELTEAEIGYIVADVEVLTAYIEEKIEQDGGIHQIPYTKTSYVRNRCRKACLKDKYANKFKSYRKLMNQLRLESEEYRQLKRAFQGGFTHASWGRVGKVHTDVYSFDEASAYPTVMIAEYFPMSKAEIVTPNMTEFREYLKTHCCLFDVRFENLRPCVWYENPISASKSMIEGARIVNNGRVVSADKLTTTVTEQDFLTYEKFYSWDRFEIANMRIYKKGYLPTDLVKTIVELYEAKTTLKGVDGMEYEYQLAKGDINSVYGMTVTDICRDENTFTDHWQETPVDIEEAITKNNNSLKRFLFYPWGVWVTAYARRNLFSAIYELQGDYIYSDTDSVKFKNLSDHAEWFTAYNAMITAKLVKACEYHKIDVAKIAPRTIKGKEKPLGVWEQEPNYQRFKTLGAKRYITETADGYGLTVSGLNKKTALPYMIDKYGDPFDGFKEGLYVPSDKTGKQTHTYIDTPQQGYIVDYQGKEGVYDELSSVHLSGADYSLSLAHEFREFLKDKGVI